MKRVLFIIAILSIATSNWAQDTATAGEQAALVWDTGDFRFHYLLFLPADYGDDPDRRWPLIFFHHGSGQRGSDANRVKVHGPPKIVEEDPDFPFIVLSPQVPLGDVSSDKAVEGFAQLLGNVVENYAVDERRIYMTGLSMGGYNTWALAHFLPPIFAALAPIAAGYLDYVAADCRVRDVPIWVFNGGRDTAVPFEDGERMVNEMRACGADIRFTAYENAHHIATWERAYGDPELYDWFLSHQLPLPSAVTDRTWGQIKAR